MKYEIAHAVENAKDKIPIARHSKAESSPVTKARAYSASPTENINKIMTKITKENDSARGWM
jgi:hypothetical protein